MKKYIDQDGQTFKACIDYCKQPIYGGSRGYYLTVLPVKITQMEGYTIEETGAFTGFRNLLLEVTRASDKAYRQAIEIGSPLIQKMIDGILTKQNEKSH